MLSKDFLKIKSVLKCVMMLFVSLNVKCVLKNILMTILQSVALNVQPERSNMGTTIMGFIEDCLKHAFEQ